MVFHDGGAECLFCLLIKLVTSSLPRHPRLFFLFSPSLFARFVFFFAAVIRVAAAEKETNLANLL